MRPLDIALIAVLLLLIAGGIAVYGHSGPERGDLHCRVGHPVTGRGCVTP